MYIPLHRRYFAANAFQVVRYLQGNTATLASHLEAQSRQTLAIHVSPICPFAAMYNTSYFASQQQQTETRGGLAELALAINSLTNTTYENLRAINDSAADIGYDLRRTVTEYDLLNWTVGSFVSYLCGKLLSCEWHTSVIQEHRLTDRHSLSDRMYPITCLALIVVHHIGWFSLYRVLRMVLKQASVFIYDSVIVIFANSLPLLSICPSDNSLWLA